MRKNKCSSCGKKYRPRMNFNDDNNRPVFNVMKNPILQLAYYRCIQQKIKLRHIYPTDSEEVKAIKSDWNFITLLEVAKTILDRLPMNYTSPQAKKEFEIYCEQIRKREDD